MPSSRPSCATAAAAGRIATTAAQISRDRGVAIERNQATPAPARATRTPLDLFAAGEPALRICARDEKIGTIGNIRAVWRLAKRASRSCSALLRSTVLADGGRPGHADAARVVTRAALNGR